MRRLSGLLLAGAILLLPAFSQGDGGAHAQAQALTFEGDVGILTIAIKPDQAAAFEDLMRKVREALMKSDKPERKEQAAGWKVVKGATPMPDGNIVYMHLIDPVVKGADYSIVAILYEGNPDPAEQQKLYDQYRNAFAAGLGGGAFTIAADLSK